MSHQSHPCSALLPFSTPHRLRMSLPHVLRGAGAEIPEQLHMQTGSSSFFHGRFAAIISPAPLLPSCFDAAPPARAESQCTARESSPAELQVRRSVKAARNLL